MEYLLNERNKILSIFYYYYYYYSLNIPNSLAKNNASFCQSCGFSYLTTQPLAVVTQKLFIYLTSLYKCKNLILPEL